VDFAISDSLRLLRLPNTRHSKSGLYKREFDESEPDELRYLASKPRQPVLTDETGLLPRFPVEATPETQELLTKCVARANHFAEYVHPEHGVVDLHGLTDVNWAAIGLSVATDDEARTLWPLVCAERAFHHDDMPTQPVARPYTYRDWELPKIMPYGEHMGPLYDAAAMGRVWYLEALACVRMGDFGRLRETVLAVCRMGKRHDWVWYERYHPLQTQRVGPAGAHPYCEYAAILVRVVLGYPEAFE
jgi:hypothetical protein